MAAYGAAMPEEIGRPGALPPGAIQAYPTALF